MPPAVLQLVTPLLLLTLVLSVVAAASGAAAGPSAAAAAPTSGSGDAAVHRDALYMDASQPIPARVADLLGKMTTEEKVAQLLELWGGKGVFEQLLFVYNHTSVGAVMFGGTAPNATCQDSPACRIHIRNELQRQLADNSRLGIPITFTQETMTSGSFNGTSFPHPVAQGSSWNMSLVHEIGKAVRNKCQLTRLLSYRLNTHAVFLGGQRGVLLWCRPRLLARAAGDH
jgi:hypothetical protein